jgi:hypothetical protein
MEDEPQVSKMSIEDGKDAKEEGSGSLFVGETSQSGGNLKPDDGTVGNHGSQDALVIPPGSTNSAYVSADDNTDVTIVNGDGENGGNGENVKVPPATKNGNPFGGELWTERVKNNACCRDCEDAGLKGVYRLRGGGARQSRRCGARRHWYDVERA